MIFFRNIILIIVLYCFPILSFGKHIVEFKDLSKVLRVINQGDTIFIKDGSYWNLNLVISSSTEFPVHIRPLNENSVIITGNSSFNFKDCTNINFGGFIFRNTASKDLIMLSNTSKTSIYDNFFYRSGSSPTNGSIIKIQNGSNYNQIYSNTFDGNQTLGILLATSENNSNDKNNVYNEIFRNIFRNIKRVKELYPKSNGNGMEAIQLGNGGTSGRWWNMKTRIYSNLFENIIGDGSEIISVKSSGNEIVNNTFRDNQSGVTIRYGNNSVIRGNFFINTKNGLRLYGKNHVVDNNFFLEGRYGLLLPAADLPNNVNLHSLAVYFQPSDITIINNTFVNQTIASIHLGRGYTKNRNVMPGRIKISNNKFYQNGKADDIGVDATSKSDSHNLVTLSNNVAHFVQRNHPKKETIGIVYHKLENKHFPEPRLRNDKVTLSPLSSKSEAIGFSHTLNIAK